MSNAAPVSSEKAADAQPQECLSISEKQFLRDHTLYSAVSSWLFAVAGATNIGVLIAFSGKILGAAEKGEPISHVLSNKKYNSIALGMTAFGGVCMAVSNWLESKKVITEWQLGAGKLQRKVDVAGERVSGTAASAAPSPSASFQPLTATQPAQTKEWTCAMQKGVSGSSAERGM